MNNSWKKALSVGALSAIAFSTYGIAGELPGAGVAVQPVQSTVATGDITEHIGVVVDGRAGTAMQSFANQLSDQEIAAVITYQRNAWGNDTGDTVQAADVNAFKAQKSAKEEI